MGYCGGWRTAWAIAFGQAEREKKPEGIRPPVFLLSDCHAFTFLHPGNGTSTKSSTLMLSGSTMM